ncbi:RimJ/RimL family protein N-acetyltransferase [Chitinophaga skermanii]|uniref:RimJ/RimL family protein N-acetyltransferase n=1 Tax=Chitinophaga skermanii TaxID=331697 RepID=A0A327PZK9_9BACT|nr:GNAT family N-acetyltransferase [Chitinophaga skermanii]RAI97670.1 RimJ/RimL family protein N-acetyltransferase [Chitinophaga skermanii]
MNFSVQPTLENDIAILYPLQADDFEALFAVASDPKVWEQHPNKDRYKRDIFMNFFDGALKSGGAFKVVEKASGQVCGSSRFYDYNEAENSIFVGYTFYGTAFWGKGLNPSVKKLMLDYIFQYVDKVLFHIGADNIRSQIAIGRIGAKKIGEEEVAYFGEPSRLNFVYAVEKKDWLK